MSRSIIGYRTNKYVGLAVLGAAMIANPIVALAFGGMAVGGLLITAVEHFREKRHPADKPSDSAS